MIDVETLYEDAEFNDFLVYTASKNFLEFDEYRQDVFVEIIESGAMTMQACKRAAWRIRDRCKKYERERKTLPLHDDEVSEDSESPLWEDNHRI